MELTPSEWATVKKSRLDQIQEKESLVKPFENDKECFCGCDVVTIPSKDGQKQYVKCGRDRDAMKEGEKPCTLFCNREEWPLILAALKQSSIKNYEDEWPECDHMLKARIAVDSQDKSKCFFTC